MKHAPIRRRDVRDVVNLLEGLYYASRRKSQNRPPEFEHLKLVDYGYQDGLRYAMQLLDGLLNREAVSDSDTEEGNEHDAGRSDFYN